jgi:putative DNA methylase
VSPPIAKPGERTFLEEGLPIRELSMLAGADRRASDPVYAAHRWWARRPPALMRGILLSSALRADCSVPEFWEMFEDSGPTLGGLSVHDPFAGGGSTLVEANRLGACVSGSDIDPLAVEISRHELDPAPAAEVREAGSELLSHLQVKVGDLYPSENGAVPLHYFWIHEVICPGCQTPGLLYRSLVLARDSRRSGAVVRDHPLTVFSPIDLTIHHLGDLHRSQLRHGGRDLALADGTFRAGKYTCPECSTRSTHRDLQTGIARRRLLAVEETADSVRRRLRPPCPSDAVAIAKAEGFLQCAEGLQLPEGKLRTERSDPRPLSFGIDTPRGLFSPRQLAVLGTAMAWLRDADIQGNLRRAMGLARSAL